MLNKDCGWWGSMRKLEDTSSILEDTRCMVISKVESFDEGVSPWCVWVWVPNALFRTIYHGDSGPTNYTGVPFYIYISREWHWHSTRADHTYPRAQLSLSCKRTRTGRTNSSIPHSPPPLITLPSSYAIFQRCHLNWRHSIHNESRQNTPQSSRTRWRYILECARDLEGHKVLPLLPSIPIIHIIATQLHILKTLGCSWIKF